MSQWDRCSSTINDKCELTGGDPSLSPLAKGGCKGGGLVTRHSSLVTPGAGFTLVELLVAMGILVILFSLLFLPLMQGINFLQRGQASTEAQGNARLAMEQMSRETAEAMYVYDNTGYPDANRLDIVLPKNLLSGTGIVSPLQPETEIVTFYVRLRDPTKAHDKMTNPFILYRAQYNPALKVGWRTAADLSTGDSGEAFIHTALLTKQECEIAGWTYCPDCPTTLSDGYLDSLSCGGTPCGPALGYIRRIYFLPTQIKEETLTPNNDYTIYRANHGLWTSGTVRVLDASGAEVSRTMTYDYHTGSVNFSQPYTENVPVSNGVGTLTPPVGAIVIAGSEAVVANGTRYSKVAGQALGAQYSIDYDAKTMRFDPVNYPASAMVSYRVRYNQSTDTVKATYVTKALITIDMTVAKYDIATGKPQNVHLKNTVEVKNAESSKSWAYGGH